MIQKIFILWASWNVWRELIRQILEKDWEDKNINPSLIVWVANSSSYIFNVEWIDESLLKDISISRKKAVEIFNNNAEKNTKLTNLVDLVEKNWLNWDVVFADVTAWKEELLEMHKYILHSSDNFLVTANKNPISLYWINEFNDLTFYSGRYNTNTTVMWWAWILGFIDERYNKINDTIKNIEWVFSWTLWYILSELEKWELSFSEIVKQAKQQGYTEPNPWDDLNWLDVARKVVILARYSGMNVDINDVIILPLIDEKYSEFKWEEFLEKIKEEDNSFKVQADKARENNQVLRYVWEIVNWRLSVGLKSVDKSSDLWNLSGTLNLAIVETDILESPLPHTIKSRWAWLEVTAWSVRVGIAKMLPNNIKTK